MILFLWHKNYQSIVYVAPIFSFVFLSIHESPKMIETSFLCLLQYKNFKFITNDNQQHVMLTYVSLSFKHNIKKFI